MYDDDVTIDDVLMQYESRLGELHTGIAQLRLPNALTAAIFVVAIGMFLVFGLYAIRAQVSYLWPCLSFSTAAFSARRLQRHRRSRSRMWRLKRFYDRAVNRLKGHWACSGMTGEEFRDPGHAYATDLHVIGEGSLFELLCTARTSIGRRGLANYLLAAPALDETLSRQEAVRELRDAVNLRERIATLGEFEFLEAHQDTFEEWLNSPTFSFPRPLRMIVAATSALLVGFVAAGLLGLSSWTSVAIWISPLVAFHAGIGLFFRSRVNRMCEWLRPLSSETHVLREGLHLLEREHLPNATPRGLRSASDGAIQCVTM